MSYNSLSVDEFLNKARSENLTRDEKLSMLRNFLNPEAKEKQNLSMMKQKYNPLSSDMNKSTEGLSQYQFETLKTKLDVIQAEMADMMVHFKDYAQRYLAAMRQSDMEKIMDYIEEISGANKNIEMAASVIANEQKQQDTLSKEESKGIFSRASEGLGDVVEGLKNGVSGLTGFISNSSNVASSYLSTPLIKKPDSPSPVKKENELSVDEYMKSNMGFQPNTNITNTRNTNTSNTNTSNTNTTFTNTSNTNRNTSNTNTTFTNTSNTNTNTSNTNTSNTNTSNTNRNTSNTNTTFTNTSNTNTNTSNTNTSNTNRNTSNTNTSNTNTSNTNTNTTFTNTSNTNTNTSNTNTSNTNLNNTKFNNTVLSNKNKPRPIVSSNNIYLKNRRPELNLETINQNENQNENQNKNIGGNENNEEYQESENNEENENNGENENNENNGENENNENNGENENNGGKENNENINLNNYNQLKTELARQQKDLETPQQIVNTAVSKLKTSTENMQSVQTGGSKNSANKRKSLNKETKKQKRIKLKKQIRTLKKELNKLGK
jgi:hypothetical protein